ncbi:unnamed protein product, partial [marine sediment metagenome]
LDAARAALIEGGVERVKVDALAKKLGVTGGSFYWHFRDRAELLGALVEHWREANTSPWFAAVARAADDPLAQFEAVVEMWIDEIAFSPAYDSAVRDWARISPEVEAAVREVDARRIELLAGIFRGFGYAKPQAFVRARITYFHQVGYYAMRIIETPAQRRRLKPLYYEGLLGAEVMRRHPLQTPSARRRISRS